MPDTASVPQHIGLIVDGNRRWAKENGVHKSEGHRQGFEAIKNLGNELLKYDVKYVTAYVFSTENWSRDKDEVEYLMNLILELFTKQMDDFMKEDIKLVVLGRRDRVSDKVLDAIDDAVERTKNNTRGTLAFCFNYGGREEIVDAVNQALEKGQEITKETIQENLYGGLDIPDLDLIVRTSGEQRISNFMLWRAGYSELLFLEKHFPAIDAGPDAQFIIESYQNRDRRFGGNSKKSQ